MYLKLDTLTIRDTNDYKGGDRLYVDVPDSKEWDDLGFKGQMKLFRERVPDILRRLNLPADTTVSYSKNAGCKMCPCSPGFIIRGTDNGNDIWAKFKLVRD